MKIEDVFNFYRDVFIPAYSDLVTFIGEKPGQIVTEIENALSHVAQYHNPDISKSEKTENVKKAHNHFVRATLDCYKLICAVIKEELEKFLSDNKSDVKQVKDQYLSFLKAFQEARKIEMQNIGINPLVSLEKYKNAALIGREALNTIHKIIGIKPRIFIGYKYTKEDETIAKKLMTLFEYEGFECVTGRTAKAEDVDEKVKKLIKSSDGTIIIFTKEKELKNGGWTTSTWLSDEKSYALGAGKPVLLFFEECISADQRKGIQGDLEYIEFNREKLDDAILRAIPYLRDFYKQVIEVKGLPL